MTEKQSHDMILFSNTHLRARLQEVQTVGKATPLIGEPQMETLLWWNHAIV